MDSMTRTCVKYTKRYKSCSYLVATVFHKFVTFSLSADFCGLYVDDETGQISGCHVDS